MKQEYYDMDDLHKLWLDMSVENFIKIADLFIGVVIDNIDICDEGGIARTEEVQMKETVMKGWMLFKKYIKDNARDGFYKYRDQV